jgi:hypothetical protein
VSQNKLVALPEDVLHMMTDLEVLNAFRNSFTTLPDLTPLQSLTVLNFGCDFPFSTAPVHISSTAPACPRFSTAVSFASSRSASPSHPYRPAPQPEQPVRGAIVALLFAAATTAAQQ